MRAAIKKLSQSLTHLLVHNEHHDATSSSIIDLLSLLSSEKVFVYIRTCIVQQHMALEIAEWLKWQVKQNTLAFLYMV